MPETPDIGYRWSLTTQSEPVPPQCITHISVDLIDLASPGEKVIGKGKGRHVDFICAASEGFSPDETVTSLHPLTSVFGVILGNSKTEFSESVTETLGEVLPICNVFHFAELALLEPFRRRGLMTSTIAEAQKIFGPSDGLAVLECCPLQHSVGDYLATGDEWPASLRYDQLEPDREKAELSLRNYYTKLGFQQIGKTPVMIKRIRLGSATKFADS